MFENLFSNLNATNANNTPTARRRFARRNCDQCVAVIDDQTYPVEDWSMGGLLIRGDVRNFGLDDLKDVTLRFKMRNEVMDVTHRGRITRKTADKIGFEFAPLTRQTRNSFQSVVDDYVTSRFADSQQSA